MRRMRRIAFFVAPLSTDFRKIRQSLRFTISIGLASCFAAVDVKRNVSLGVLGVSGGGGWENRSGDAHWMRTRGYAEGLNVVVLFDSLGNSHSWSMRCDQPICTQSLRFDFGVLVLLGAMQSRR